MRGQHLEAKIGTRIICSNIVCLQLGNHACDGVTPLPWPTETAFGVIVGRCDGVLQAFTLNQMHQGKGLCAGGVYLML